MSTFQALALILGTSILGSYVNIMIMKAGVALANGIVVGIVDGIPISPEHRWMLVWNHYLPMNNTGAGLALVGAIGLVQVGRNVADPKVQLLAYLAAGAAGLSCLLWVLGTVTGILYLRSAMRDAETR